MPVIYADSGDGYIKSSNSGHGSWAAARDVATGGTPDTNDGFTSPAAGVLYAAGGGKGGSASYTVIRAFFFFDFSSVSGTVDSGATLSIRGFTTSGMGTNSARIVKSTAFGGDGGTALAAADFDAITGFSSGNTMSGNVTDYSSTVIGAWNASGFNDFTLNATAINDINTNGHLIVCLVEKGYDYDNDDPASGGFWADRIMGITWRDRGTPTAPHIDYTVTSGYGNTVNGVAPANIGQVKGVAVANIEKVIGV
jgi:hypothetical protein